MSWTAERVALLKKLVAEDLSCSQIAGRLNVTRNAVIGKIQRMGLQNTRPATRPRVAVRARKPRTQRPSTPQAKTTAIQAILESQPFIEAEETIIIPVDQRQGILARDNQGRLCANEKLTATSCRWPIGDPREPGFHLCCQETVPTSPYCEHHTRRAYVPVPPRKPRNETDAPPRPRVPAFIDGG